MTSRRAHIPVRTCIGCRQRRSKYEMIRLALTVNGLVVRDNLGKEKGRGAYVCPSDTCCQCLEKGHTLKRAFKKEGPITLDSKFREGALRRFPRHLNREGIWPRSESMN